MDYERMWNNLKERLDEELGCRERQVEMIGTGDHELAKALCERFIDIVNEIEETEEDANWKSLKECIEEKVIGNKPMPPVIMIYGDPSLITYILPKHCEYHTPRLAYKVEWGFDITYVKDDRCSYNIIGIDKLEGSKKMYFFNPEDGSSYMINLADIENEESKDKGRE